MPDTSGLNPRQLAAFDQFHATFRDMQAEFCASLQSASAAFAVMSRSLRDFGEEIQVTGLQLGIEDGETLQAHADLAQLDRHLDAHYGTPES